MNYVISQTLGRIPVSAEVDGIVEQVDIFYTEILSNAFPDFESFTPRVTSTNSNIAGSFTITMLAYTGDVTFKEGATLPTQEEVATAIQGADLNLFRLNYVVNASPQGTLFVNTVMVSSAATN
jgi:hypothetical protein